MTEEKLTNFNNLYNAKNEAIKSNNNAKKIKEEAKAENADLVIQCNGITCIVTDVETKNYIMDKLTYYTDRLVKITTTKFDGAK